MSTFTKSVYIMLSATFISLSSHANVYPGSAVEDLRTTEQKNKDNDKMLADLKLTLNTLKQAYDTSRTDQFIHDGSNVIISGLTALTLYHIGFHLTQHAKFSSSPAFVQKAKVLSYIIGAGYTVALGATVVTSVTLLYNQVQLYRLMNSLEDLIQTIEELEAFNAELDAME